MRLYRCESCWLVYGLPPGNDAPAQWPCVHCHGQVRFYFGMGLDLAAQI